MSILTSYSKSTAPNTWRLLLFNYWWECKWSTPPIPPFTSWLLFQLQTSGESALRPDAAPSTNLALCIIKRRMRSTAESRIVFCIFAAGGLRVNVSAESRNPTPVAPRGEQWPQSHLIKLSCDSGVSLEGERRSRGCRRKVRGGFDSTRSSQAQKRPES